MSFRLKKTENLNQLWTIPFEVPTTPEAPKPFETPTVISKESTPFAYLGVRAPLDVAERISFQEEERELILTETCVNRALTTAMYRMKVSALGSYCSFNFTTMSAGVGNLSTAREAMMRATFLSRYDVIPLFELEEEKVRTRDNPEEDKKKQVVQIALNPNFKEIVCLVESLVASTARLDLERNSFAAQRGLRQLISGTFPKIYAEKLIEAQTIRFPATANTWEGSLEDREDSEIVALWRALQDKAMILRDNLVSLVITNPLVDNLFGDGPKTPCFQYGFGCWEEEETFSNTEDSTVFQTHTLNVRKENMAEGLSLWDFMNVKIRELDGVHHIDDFRKMTLKFQRAMHVIYFQIFGSLAAAAARDPTFTHGNLDPKSSITIMTLRRPRFIEIRTGNSEDESLFISTRYLVKIGNFYDSHFEGTDRSTIDEIDKIFDDMVPHSVKPFFEGALYDGPRREEGGFTTFGFGPSPRFSRGVGDLYSFFRPTNARPNKPTILEDIVQVTLNTLPLVDSYPGFVEKTLEAYNIDSSEKANFLVFACPGLVWLHSIIPYTLINPELVSQVVMASTSAGKTEIPMIIRERYQDNLQMSYKGVLEAGRRNLDTGGLFALFQPNTLSSGLTDFIPSNVQPHIILVNGYTEKDAVREYEPSGRGDRR